MMGKGTYLYIHNCEFLPYHLLLSIMNRLNLLSLSPFFFLNPLVMSSLLSARDNHINYVSQRPLSLRLRSSKQLSLVDGIRVVREESKVLEP